MNGGVDRIFIDTNVLVYANVVSTPLHQVAQQAIHTHEAEGAELWISRQVLREYLATLSRPQTFTAPVTNTILATQVRLFKHRFRVADEDYQVSTRLLILLEQIAIGGRQIHDANIVASMQVYGVTRLLTNNPNDFTRFAHLISILPLI